MNAITVFVLSGLVKISGVSLHTVIYHNVFAPIASSHHAIPGNEARLWAFRKDVLRLWLYQVRRHSQRSRWTWERPVS